MYLVGAPHPHKTDAQRLLDRAVADSEPLVTDAEVLQEILHRYGAIRRYDAIQPAFDALLGVVDQILPIDLPAVERAKTIVLGPATSFGSRCDSYCRHGRPRNRSRHEF